VILLILDHSLCKVHWLYYVILNIAKFVVIQSLISMLYVGMLLLSEKWKAYNIDVGGCVI
jgi:hypothetical protein